MAGTANRAETAEAVAEWGGRGGGRRGGGGGRGAGGTAFYDAVYLASDDLMQKQDRTQGLDHAD